MKKVFIVHGFVGIPNGGWIPWLMEELAKNKIFACALAMPNPKNPSVPEWIEEISHAVNNAPDDEIYLVGHSLGATAVMKYLESIPNEKKVSGVVLISGLISPLDPENSKSNYRAIDSFVVPSIYFEKVKNKSDKFILLHSVDDPAVPFAHAEIISKELNCKLVKVDKYKHFFILAEPICYQIPELLKIIDEILE